MRVTYRGKDTRRYWEERWEAVGVDEAMESQDAYPLRYAEMTTAGSEGRIFEAGCGAGRILRYYKARGHRITGMDYVPAVIQRLKATDPELEVCTGDIRHLPWSAGCFRHILAFGLYHGLEEGLDDALAETHRVLESGGSVCASFRADNLQTRAVDWLADRRAARKSSRSGARHFHKLNLTRKEVLGLFQKAGFSVSEIYAVENMPFLYKFALFRAPTHRLFAEHRARTEGYRLTWLGNAAQRVLMKVWPDQFCNLFVVIGHK